MELITILNRCRRFRGFVYQQAHFSADKKSIEAAVRPRKGSVAICSRCRLPAPGYDQLGERRFEFLPLMGVSRLPPVHPWGDGKRTLTKAYGAFLHGFQQRGLRFRSGAVDLVGKRRAFAPRSSASIIMLPTMSAGMRSGMNWMRE